MPSHWKLLDIMAYVGPVDIRFVCRDEVVERKRETRGKQKIHYTDYLTELIHKPQAVRQVAPELLSELGKPFRRLWELMEQTHGGKEAGRVLARVLEAMVKYGEEEVGAALKRAFDAGQSHLLDLAVLRELPVQEIEVPVVLRQYVIESARATDFNYLLEEVAP